MDTAMRRDALIPRGPALEARIAALPAIAREAARLAVAMQAAASAGRTLKGDQDWLTEADGAVEALIRERVAEAFPGDAVLGEETGLTGDASAMLWIVDPIDGTANYARGGRTWCVSIALVEERRALAGAVVAPALRETWLARRGRGARLNGRPLRAAATDDLRRALVEVGWSPRRPFADWQALTARLNAAGAAVRLGGSGALGLCQVAAGRTDGYAELHINSWDAAAALLIAEEAGARVSDILGGEALHAGAPVLAAAPGVARALSALCGVAGSLSQ
ncbi:MAG: inositol monophosphatase family protein [Acetobacteraceae bacterium]